MATAAPPKTIARERRSCTMRRENSRQHQDGDDERHAHLAQVNCGDAGKRRADRGKAFPPGNRAGRKNEPEKRRVHARTRDRARCIEESRRTNNHSAIGSAIGDGTDPYTVSVMTRDISGGIQRLGS